MQLGDGSLHFPSLGVTLRYVVGGKLFEGCSEHSLLNGIEYERRVPKRGTEVSTLGLQRIKFMRCSIGSDGTSLHLSLASEIVVWGTVEVASRLQLDLA